MVALAAGVLAVGYFAWFRDSSLVAVGNVRIEGAAGADRERVVASLTDAARGMTTLHVDEGALRKAVSGFPNVAAVSADPSFPHGLTIHVTERQPALLAVDGGRQVPVAADGTVLKGLDAKGTKLPRLPVDSLPGSGRLSGEPLQEALATGAAPAPLRPLVDGVGTTREYGIVVTLRGGIELRFGTGAAAAAKWAAAAAILADPTVTTLAYVDVRVPQRPAVGGAGAAPVAG